MIIKNRILAFGLALLSSSLIITPLSAAAEYVPPTQQEETNPLTIPPVDLIDILPEDLTDMLLSDNDVDGAPFEPDNVNGIHGITYELHTDGVSGFTDETVAVLEISHNANARLLAGVPNYGSLQGYRSVGQMAKSYTEQGYDVIAAINGGFFGLTNPAGTQVMNQGVFIRYGELLRNWEPNNSNEYISQEHYIIGTLKNGDFFHGYNPLHTMQISVNGSEVRTLQNLNSPRSTGNPSWQDLTLLTERFGETVPSPPDKLAGTDVRLEIVGGIMALGEELVMRVIQPSHPAADNAPIGTGHAILTAANAGDIAFLNSLKEGDTITVSHTFTNRRDTSVDWSQVDQAIATHFLLIKNGSPQPLPGHPDALVPVYPEITPNPETGNPLSLLPSQNTKRPRTGVGLRADGTMVWVVVSGDSGSGMTVSEFQDYLIALGLEYAWNFDGGASSAMVIGETLVTYSMGRDSDFQRPVANGLVLVSPPLADNTVEITLQPYPQNFEMAQGNTSGRLTVRARSTAGELNYQWYQNGEPVGTNSPVFVIPPDLEVGKYDFYVVVGAETAPSQNSNKATVTVIEPPPFIDVQDGDWFADDVMFTYKKGLMSGTNTNPMMFSPNMTLTRGMLVTTLYRKSGSPDVSGLTNPFSDVPAELWYADAVIWAAHNGIVQGVGGRRFDPDQSITREQIAVIMLRYAGAANQILPDVYEEDLVFADNAAVSDWASEAVKTIRQAGIIFGRPGNLFDPQGNATRAEAAAILRRFIESVI